MLHWRNWLVLLLGAWLSLSPLVLSYPSGVAAHVLQITGVAIMLFATLALLEYRAWEAWANLALALWLITVPSAFDFAEPNATTWNAVLVGAVIAISALTALTRSTGARRRRLPR